MDVLERNEIKGRVRVGVRVCAYINRRIFDTCMRGVMCVHNLTGFGNTWTDWFQIKILGSGRQQRSILNDSFLSSLIQLGEDDVKKKKKKSHDH